MTAEKCQSDSRYTRTACASSARCIDAGDDNGDYLVDRSDSGVCRMLATASATPTATATFTATEPLPDTATPTGTSTPTQPPTETPTSTPSDTATSAPTATEPPAVTPTAEAIWTFCANEGATCDFPGNGYVRYGANGTYQIHYFTETSVPCTNAQFGDPAPLVAKHCAYNVTDAMPTTTPVPTQTPTPTVCGAGGIIPHVDVNFPDDPQSPVPPRPGELRCGPQSLGGGGCQLTPLEGSIDNFFDASASVDAAMCPGDPAPSFHWEIFFPTQLGGTGYSSFGITGYHDAALTIRPGSLPSLAGTTDVFWRVRLTVTSRVTGQTRENWFNFEYQTTLTLQQSTNCQNQPQLCPNEAANLRPATEPT